ncbi:hypothetical protein GF354_06720 [Candidatus Peregrinibacteria bacterium]|nr:hypothetical protein [Candidatus Peregrinibacteria bacterium]
MKKIAIILSSFFVLFLLPACSLKDFFIDDVAIHNELVDKMDRVLDTEEEFYDVFIVLFEGDGTEDLRTKYDAFNSAVLDLDDFFMNTDFASSQEVFKEQYNDYYRPFILQYSEYAGQFVRTMEEDGVTFENMDPYLDKLDQYTLDFIETHNKLIKTINLQADEI